MTPKVVMWHLYGESLSVPRGILFQGGAYSLQPQLLMLPLGSAVGWWDIGNSAPTCWHFEWCFGLHWAIISGLMVAKGDRNIIEKINFLQNLSPNSSVFKDWKWSSVNHWTVTVGLYSNWSPVSSQCLSGGGGSSDICWPSRVTDRMDPNHYTQESSLKTVNDHLTTSSTSAHGIHGYLPSIDNKVTTCPIHWLMGKGPGPLSIIATTTGFNLSLSSAVSGSFLFFLLASCWSLTTLPNGDDIKVGLPIATDSNPGWLLMPPLVRWCHWLLTTTSVLQHDILNRGDDIVLVP